MWIIEEFEEYKLPNPGPVNFQVKAAVLNERKDLSHRILKLNDSTQEQ